VSLKQNLINSYRNKTTPIKVLLKRGSCTESIHKAHAVVADSKGRVLMYAGDPNYETFIRSALKPFQAIPFLSSGTAEHINSGDKGVAIACGSHMGTTFQSRESFKLLWNADIDVSALQCPLPVDKKSKLQHNCSGKHAAFLATCKKMNWPLENYLHCNHPLQKEIFRRISEILAIPSEELVAAKDDCGAPTLLLQIDQMAKLYANLSGSLHPELEQINRAMLQNPELISGDGGFDTELMNRAHRQIVSKGGSEGIQCLARIGEGLGLAIKIEDGSKRAKHAVAIHLLKQLEWITPTGLRELEEKMLLLRPGVQLEVQGELKFQAT
tara:strand:+ start:39 stop:1016 length:978 start_codon:yes stop_codon:yes gene_type:complete